MQKTKRERSKILIILLVACCGFSLGFGISKRVNKKEILQIQEENAELIKRYDKEMNELVLLKEANEKELIQTQEEKRILEEENEEIVRMSFKAGINWLRTEYMYDNGKISQEEYNRVRDAESALISNLTYESINEYIQATDAIPGMTRIY